MPTTDLITHLRDVQSAIEAYGCDALLNHPAVVSIDTAINCALSDAIDQLAKKRGRPVLEAIERLWEHEPQWRLCQMIINVRPDHDPRPLFYLTGEELCRRLGYAIGVREAKR